jgi:hypothetical protein
LDGIESLANLSSAEHVVVDAGGLSDSGCGWRQLCEGEPGGNFVSECFEQLVFSDRQSADVESGSDFCEGFFRETAIDCLIDEVRDHFVGHNDLHGVSFGFEQFAENGIFLESCVVAELWRELLGPGTVDFAEGLRHEGIADTAACGSFLDPLVIEGPNGGVLVETVS